jgi:hypothetical protein
MRVELQEDERYTMITAKKPLPVRPLESLNDVVKQEEVKKFYAEGAFGNNGP